MSVLFLSVNVAYVALIPREEIRNSGPLIAALFFHCVFGPAFGVKVLPLLVAFSCFGNMVGTNRLHPVGEHDIFYPGLCKTTKSRGYANDRIYIMKVLCL